MSDQYVWRAFFTARSTALTLLPAQRASRPTPSPRNESRCGAFAAGVISHGASSPRCGSLAVDVGDDILRAQIGAYGSSAAIAIPPRSALTRMPG